MVEVVAGLGLRVEPIAAMLNFELADHPVYSGVEVQRFDDDVHGQGLLVFLNRREDDRADFYVSDGLSLDRSMFHIGAGIGEWSTAMFESATLEVAADGVRCEVAFTDRHGTRIELDIDDTDGHPRRRGGLLAPVGAGIQHPRSLLLVWMPTFDLVRTGGRVSISFDGAKAATGALPLAGLHRHRLVKYAADLDVITINPMAGDRSAVAAAEHLQLGVDDKSVHALVGAGGRVVWHLEPPVADIREMGAHASQSGRWTIAADRQVLTGGTWSIRRTGEDASMLLEVTRPWWPRRVPLLMRVVTTLLGVFRRWPTTYRFAGVIDLSPPWTLRGGWHRTGGNGAESYRNATRS